ncbi:hypothetical protein HYX16_06120 [Candidatus Woesearchaeota archaeon]|nr:hypothetical protein [Candidatus Woesearchaeota archaeon]
MRTEKELVELRNEMKSNKPKFRRQDWFLKGLNEKWRKPKGLDSKLRARRRGKGAHISPGYGSPSKVRGLSREGLNFVFVRNLKDLDIIGKDDLIVLNGNLGARKKIEILKKIKEKKLKMFNFNDLEKAIKKFTDNFEARKKEKEEKKKQKTQKESEKEKAKPKEEIKETDEEKKKREQEEKRRVLEGKA